MNRQLKRKIRWRAVRNAFYDTKLADKARDWSDERILRELGIKIPKTLPKLKEMPAYDTPKRNVLEKRKELELAKFQYLLNKGYDIATARKLKRRSWEKLQTLDIGVRIPLSRDKREKNWRKWASGQDFPDWMGDLAEKLNREEYDRLKSEGIARPPVGKNHSHGWAVLFYAYMNNDLENTDKYVPFLRADKFDGNLYENLIQLTT